MFYLMFLNVSKIVLVALISDFLEFIIGWTKFFCYFGKQLWSLGFFKATASNKKFVCDTPGYPISVTSHSRLLTKLKNNRQMKKALRRCVLVLVGRKFLILELAVFNSSMVVIVVSLTSVASLIWPSFSLGSPTVWPCERVFLQDVQY